MSRDPRSLVPPLPPETALTLGRFLRAHVDEAQAKGVVVGLSGGVDSALVARLAKDALGAERVWSVHLPDDGVTSEQASAVQRYAADLGIAFRTVPLGPLEAPFRGLGRPFDDRRDLGNLKARLRMVLLHAEARTHGALVAGTGNKSELLLGYFTKHGDGGVDLLPLGDLYKTAVWALARELELPPAIVEQAPSAGLWAGQTDEAELGLPYALLDQVLYGLERLLRAEEIAERTGLAPDVVGSVIERVRRNRHKRRPPPIPKLSLRTLGLDWRD